MQVPGLVISLCAPSGKYGLVVNFDKLPFRPVAEVSEKPANRQRKKGLTIKLLTHVQVNQETFISWFRHVMYALELNLAKSYISRGRAILGYFISCLKLLPISYKVDDIGLSEFRVNNLMAHIIHSCRNAL